MTTIYEMYGRQEERHVQETEELQTKLAGVSSLLLTTVKRLKDGSLKIEDIELTDESIRIPGAKDETAPLEPEVPSPNGTGRARAKARTE